VIVGAKQLKVINIPDGLNKWYYLLVGWIINEFITGIFRKSVCDVLVLNQVNMILSGTRFC
jgi:hypothetical protein